MEYNHGKVTGLLRGEGEVAWEPKAEGPTLTGDGRHVPEERTFRRDPMGTQGWSLQRGQRKGSRDRNWTTGKGKGEWGRWW